MCKKEGSQIMKDKQTDEQRDAVVADARVYICKHMHN